MRWAEIVGGGTSVGPRQGGGGVIVFCCVLIAEPNGDISCCEVGVLLRSWKVVTFPRVCVHFQRVLHFRARDGVIEPLFAQVRSHTLPCAILCCCSWCSRPGYTMTILCLGVFQVLIYKGAFFWCVLFSRVPHECCVFMRIS